MSTISQVWIFCSIDPSSGEESVIALNTPDGTAMPMMFHDPTAIDNYRLIARNIAWDNGIKIILKRFSTMTVEETILPPPGAGVH